MTPLAFKSVPPGLSAYANDPQKVQPLILSVVQVKFQ